MSGGTFDYNQHRIYDIAEHIESVLDRQGKEYVDEYTKKYYENLGATYEPSRYETFKPAVQERFMQAIVFLHLAYLYAHRIDWLLAGDDGEETFLERLDEQIRQFEVAFDEKWDVKK
jgi:hypothetical protein